MTKIQDYKELDTDLDNPYNNSIKAEIENESNLQIVSQYKGEMNGKHLRSVVALNKSLKVFAGSLREIHVFTLGTSEDYAVEVASGAWFGSIIFPGAVGLIVGGPIGLAAGATFGGIMAYEYEKHMRKEILEIVQRESRVQPTVDSIDRYHSGIAQVLRRK
jgi:hypothetical protein